MDGLSELIEELQRMAQRGENLDFEIYGETPECLLIKSDFIARYEKNENVFRLKHSVVH